MCCRSRDRARRRVGERCRTCIVMSAMAATFAANDRSYRAPAAPVLAICADGWDPDYVDDALERALMPRLAEALDGGGTYALGRAQVPTFTNPNNITIVTGVSAARNGIAGNHYRDERGDEVQVTDPSFLRAHTIHAAARGRGGRRPVRDRQGQAARAARGRRRSRLQRRARARAGDSPTARRSPSSPARPTRASTTGGSRPTRSTSRSRSRRVSMRRSSTPR